MPGCLRKVEQVDPREDGTSSPNTGPSMSTLRESVFPSGRYDADDDGMLPIRIGFEGNQAALRAFFRFTGAVFILSAPGLWLLPGSNADPSLVLYKVGAAIFFVFCGVALILRNKLFTQPEVYFDPIRREMRILLRNARGRPTTVLKRSYGSLGAAKITRRQLEIWDVDGSVLLRLPLADPEAHRALRLNLGDLVR